MTSFMNLMSYSLQDLQQMRQMCQEAIEYVQADGREPEARAFEVLANYDAQIARLTGSISLNASSRVEDEVRTVRDSLGRARQPFGQGGAHIATDKQVKFLQRLVDTKDLGEHQPPADVTGISKKSCSAWIDKLIDRPNKGVSVTAQSTNAPSEKQVALLTKLFAEKNWAGVIDGIDVDTNQAVPADLTGGRGGSASQLIDTLFAAPRKTVERTVAAELAPGAYWVQGKVVRVYLGQQSRQMLAAELVDITAEAREDAWKYLGRADRFVSADDRRLTVEEAESLAAEGADHSWCCVCSRRLDDPNSVTRGIGPVCRAKQGGQS